MESEKELIVSLKSLRENFFIRKKELDDSQQKDLLDALHELYTSTNNLQVQLQGLVIQLPAPESLRPILYLVK